MAKKDPRLDALKNFSDFRFGAEDPVKFLPTGYTELDHKIAAGELENLSMKDVEKRAEESNGGLPIGKVVMIYGGPGSGKSSLGYRVCGYAQRMYPSRVPIWYDLENSFSGTLANINGCDTAFLGRRNTWDEKDPEAIYSMEWILDDAIQCIKNEASVIVIDSVASLIPKFVLENPAEKDTMAIKARIFAKTLPKITSLAASHGCLVILLNQLRNDPGSYTGGDGTTGGNTLKHLVSLILKMNKTFAEKQSIVIENEDGVQDTIAQKSNIYIEKNRFSRPYRKPIEVPIYFRYYFPEFEEILFNAGRQTKVISVRLDVYSWKNIKVKGRANFIDELRKNQDSLLDLISEIKEAASNEDPPIPLPPEIVNADKYMSEKKFVEGKITKSSKSDKNDEGESAEDFVPAKVEV